jgi:cytochrome c-type biogenesis protein CcmE
MTRKQRRLILIGSSLGVLGIAAALVLSALKDSIVFFNSPTDIVEKKPAAGARLRIGGLVKPGTLVRGDNLQIRFEVTDGNKDLAVRYQGIFVADSVLAKHDEKYMPREVVDALKKTGHWQEGEDAGSKKK